MILSVRKGGSLLFLQLEETRRPGRALRGVLASSLIDPGLNLHFTAFIERRRKPIRRRLLGWNSNLSPAEVERSSWTGNRSTRVNSWPALYLYQGLLRFKDADFPSTAIFGKNRCRCQKADDRRTFGSRNRGCAPSTTRVQWLTI